MLLLMYPKVAGKPAYLAGAAAADAIAARLARKMAQTLGPLSAQEQQQWEHYVALAQQLRTAYATDGEGTIGLSPTRNVVLAAPVLGGGGETVLGNNTLPYGGAL